MQVKKYLMYTSPILLFKLLCLCVCVGGGGGGVCFRLNLKLGNLVFFYFCYQNFLWQSKVMCMYRCSCICIVL